MKFKTLFFIAMLYRLEIMLALRKLQQKCFILGFIGLVFSRMFTYMLSLVMLARARNISRREHMFLGNILKVEIFDLWGIDFMGLFSFFYGNKYILVVVDYVSN